MSNNKKFVIKSGLYTLGVVALFWCLWAIVFGSIPVQKTTLLTLGESSWYIPVHRGWDLLAFPILAVLLILCHIHTSRVLRHSVDKAGESYFGFVLVLVTGIMVSGFATLVYFRIATDIFQTVPLGANFVFVTLASLVSVSIGLWMYQDEPHFTFPLFIFVGGIIGISTGAVFGLLFVITAGVLLLFRRGLVAAAQTWPELLLDNEEDPGLKIRNNVA